MSKSAQGVDWLTILLVTFLIVLIATGLLLLAYCFGLFHILYFWYSLPRPVPPPP